MNVLTACACLAASFVAVAGLNWLDLIPWRKTRGDHWTWRARVLWPVRRKAAILLLYMPLLVTAGSTLMGGHASAAVLASRWLCAFAGALGGSWFLTKELFPALRLRQWLHDLAVGLLLRAGYWLIFIAIGLAMPDRFGSRTWLFFAAAMLVQVLWSFVALWVLRLLRVLQPAGGRLRRIVADCTRDGGPRVRGLWQAGGVTANAYALPLSGTMVFLDPLLDVLTDEEVAAICAHELGHLAEPPRMMFARHLGAMALLPLLLVRPVSHLGASGGWLPAGILLLVLAVIFWSRLARQLMCRMETRADEFAHRAQAADGVYARALEKIYQVNQLPAVLPGSAMTHPHLYDRMIAAGVTPDFPRPLPPARFNLMGWLLVIASPLVIGWMIANW